MKGGRLSLIRRVGNPSGIEAWRKIRQKFSPSTPATVLIDLMWVMSPGRAQNHRELFTTIKERQVRRDHGAELSEKTGIAALVQMLLGRIRDIVCQKVRQP